MSELRAVDDGVYASSESVMTLDEDIFMLLEIKLGMNANACADASLFERSQGQLRASLNRMLIRVYPFGIVVAADTGTMTDGQSLGKAAGAELVEVDPVGSPSGADVEVAVTDVVKVFANKPDVCTNE